MTVKDSAIDLPELSLVALVGVSGSGKSTFAGRHFAATEVLSSDFCRGLVADDENDQAATRDAFDVLYYIAGKRLAAGRLTVVDATNVQPDARRQLVETAREHDVLPVAIVLDMPLSVCAARNAERQDRAFGERILRRQQDQLRLWRPATTSMPCQTDPMTGYQTIRYQRDGDIGTLTLARPAKRNAQNPLMWQELTRLGAELLPDQTLRCLVVTGEGPAFSAGIDLVEGMAGIVADLGTSNAGDEEEVIAAGLAMAGTFNWIPGLGCPSVAAVRGHAYGAGLQLALACDFRIFAEGTKAGLIETRYGLLPDMGATVRLPRIVGESRARELILLGEVIDAAEALRIGLANRVVPDADLETAAAEFAGRLAAQPPVALRGARRAIDAAWHCGPEESFRLALEEQLRCLRSEDFAEALQALAEGRTPQWRGR